MKILNRLYIKRIYSLFNKMKRISISGRWLNFKQFFHWPFINEKQSMFTFASLVSLQAIDIFLLIFNLFPLFAERGRRNLEEIIHNENLWPQLLHKSGVECQIDRFACFAAHSLFIFSERKCISRSWRKLMNYKPEKRIPWLFTDFDNIKDFPWLFSAEAHTRCQTKTTGFFGKSVSTFLWLAVDRQVASCARFSCSILRCLIF